MWKTVLAPLLVIAVLLLSACQPIRDAAEMQAALTPTPTSMVITSPSEVPRITLDEAKKHFDEGTALFIDARSKDAYEQAHIAGAILL